MITVNNDEPQEGLYYDKAGSYKQVFRVHTPVIDKGEKIKIEQFFSGYGINHFSKLVFFCSKDIFEQDSSLITYGYKENEIDKDGKKSFEYGGEKKEFDKIGMFFDLSGAIKLNDWKHPTMYFDVNQSNCRQISTEMVVNESPFKYELKTKKNIKPGLYYLEFNYTYFNGVKWETDNRVVEFKVRNFIERHDTLIGVIATIASILAILGLGILPFFQWMMKILTCYFFL